MKNLVNANISNNRGVRINDTFIGSRGQINIVAGSNAIISGSDDPSGNEIDVTFTATGSGGTSTIPMSDTPPSSPIVGSLWWDTANLKLKIYYNDGSSIQWVDATPQGMTSTRVDAGIFSHTASAGTDGGTATSGSWQDRPINTTNLNQVDAVLSANTITLNAGDYDVEIYQEFVGTGDTSLRLYNTTDAAVETGVIFQSSQVDAGVSRTLVGQGRISISATKAYKLQYYASNTVSTVGLGNASNGGTSITEVYATIIIRELVPTVGTGTSTGSSGGSILSWSNLYSTTSTWGSLY